MGRGKDLTEVEKGQILGLKAGGLSVTEIAKRIGRGKATVSKFLNNKRSPAGRKKCGRKQKLSSRQRRIIVRTMSKGETSANRIVREMNLNVTRQTVVNVLKNTKNLKYVKRKQQPRLTPQHIANRLKFARDHQTWDRTWRTVIFSDEKKFNLDGPDGLKYYWHDLRREGQVFSKRVGGGGSIMVWGAFAYAGKIHLVEVKGRMNAKKYQDMLEANLLPYATDIAGDTYIFQQDNAACHAAKTTIEWFNGHNIKLLPWPACSPDLNPIENLWGDMARAVYANGKQYNTVAELRTAIYEAWSNISMETLQKLVDSMKVRIFELALNKGSKIKY